MLIVVMENPWIKINWDNRIPECDWYYFALLGALSAKKIDSKDFNKITERIKTDIKKQGSFDSVKSNVLSYYKQNNLQDLINDFVNHYVETNKIQLNTLPEPYTGDPESKVYFLNMNPGKRDESFEKVEYNRLKLELLTQLTLNHQLKHSMWYDLKGHDGYYWICNKTRQIIKDNPYPRYFMIEYFPYHTDHGFNFPEYLPSYEYSNELIKKAINDEKLFIIMRYTEQWEQRFINVEIPFSKFKYAKLKNHQNISISKGNIVYGDNLGSFDELKKKLIIINI